MFCDYVHMSVGVSVCVHSWATSQCAFVTTDACYQMCLCMASLDLCLCEDESLTFGSSWDPHTLEQVRLGKTGGRAFRVGWGELLI